MSSEIAKPVGPNWKPERTFPKRFPNGFPQGRRTERRQKENAKLNNLGIRHCELGISPYCYKTSGLTWCHSRKSRFLVTPEDWQDACRACLPCHSMAEEMSHADMFRAIRAAIARRK